MEITLPAIIENVEKVTAFVNAELEKLTALQKQKPRLILQLMSYFQILQTMLTTQKLGKLQSSLKFKITQWLLL